MYCSETQEITEYRCKYNGRTYVIIDTPRFDDSYRSNDGIVDAILDWLESSYRSGTRLSGIIYLHRISDIRMQGSAFDNLRMFRKLCGANALPNVLLVTTFWDTVSQHEGDRRERELKSNDEFWGRMVKKGSKMKRWARDYSVSATFAILDEVTPDAKCTLQAQEEIVDQGKDRCQTEAVRVTLETMRADMDARLRREQEEIREAMEQREREARERLRRERERMERKAEERRKEEEREQQMAEDRAYAEFILQRARLREQMRIERERKEQEQRQIEEMIREEEETRKREEQEMRECYYASYQCVGYEVGKWRTCNRCGENLHKIWTFYFRKAPMCTFFAFRC